MKSASFGQVVKCGLFSYLQAYATEETVRTLYAKLHDELLVATMLALTSEDVTTALDQWSDRPQATSYKTPARKGGWTRKELLILGQRWFCGDAINEISHMIGRTPGSISAKRRRLGLPPRIRLSKAQAEAIQEEKRAAIPEDPTIILTWEQASSLPPTPEGEDLVREKFSRRNSVNRPCGSRQVYAGMRLPILKLPTVTSRSRVRPKSRVTS